jgi:hypothetical protein
VDFYEYIWKTVCINSYDYDYIYTFTNNVTTVYSVSNNNVETIDENDNPATELVIANEVNNDNSRDNNSPKFGRQNESVSVQQRDIEFNGLESLDDNFLSYLDNPPELQAVSIFISIIFIYYDYNLHHYS